MGGWRAEDIPDQTGRTFVVTGGNSGLGYETARQVARRGARVVLTARDMAKGEAAVKRLRRDDPSATVEVRELDLADLDSVQAFAAGISGPLDVLVNNGGIMMTPHRLSAQGHELQFATNHLGHYALTGLLLGRLGEAAAAGRDARVVTVSSALHRRGSIDFDDLDAQRGYNPTRAYAQSKLANVLFGLELDRRLRAAGSPVRSLLAHPGYAATNLQSTGPTGLARSLMKVGNVIMAQSVGMGALCQLRAATDPDALGGQFFGPGGFGEQRGHPKLVQPSKAGQDTDVAGRLWAVSEVVTGVTFALGIP